MLVVLLVNLATVRVHLFAAMVYVAFSIARHFLSQLCIRVGEAVVLLADTVIRDCD